MNRRAFITGVSGPALDAAEREFIRSQRPWGFILFKRNIETPAQVISLVEELRKAIGDPEAPVLIDQEGGRVQRLGPPHWPLYPAVGFASRSIPTRTLRFPRENLKTLESTRTMRLMISFLGKK